MSGLWVLGAIPPEPAGGVSTFVERLVHSSAVHVEGVVDPYWGRKNSIEAKHIVAKGPGVLHRVGALRHLLRLRGHRLLINGSNPRAVLALAPFLVGRKTVTFLLLHHGDLRLAGGWVGRLLFRFAMRRYSYVACLSERQAMFYRSHGVDESKLVLVDSYLPAIQNGIAENSPLLEDVLSWLRSGVGKLVISSGYAEDFYHHGWLLDALRDTSDFVDLRYVVCCYGPETPVLDALRVQASGVKRARVIHGLTPAEFNFLLEQADVYVRPTDVDSFGIAAWDAAAKNLAIVASDVCRRPPGSFVHPQGDRQKFLKSVRSALDGDKGPPQQRTGEARLVKIREFLQKTPAREYNK
jgi:hypothetical protein